MSWTASLASLPTGCQQPSSSGANWEIIEEGHFLPGPEPAAAFSSSRLLRSTYALCGLSVLSCSPLLPPLSVCAVRAMGILCVILASVRNLWHANTLPLARTACDLPACSSIRLTTGHHSAGDAVPAEFLELSGIFSLALTLAVPSTSSLWGQLVSSARAL